MPAGIAALSTVVLSCAFAGPGAAAMPAFPGAEGYGAISMGGRGGRVIRVTTLEAGGPGSLQEAAAASGPRTVVFDVGGVIHGDVVIRHSRITIAGQTAPAPGITIAGRLLVRPEPWTRLSDIIVRFVRLRPPPTGGHDGDALQFPDTERVMLDHLSLAWASDETVDIIHASDLTLQWSTLEESDTRGHAKGPGHNFGLISAYPGSGNVSIHHNLFAHHSRRSPSLTPYEPGKPADFRNNVVYGFREGLTHDGHVPSEAISLVGNFYKRGPGSTRIAPFRFHPAGRYYVEGNVVDGHGAFDGMAPGRTLPRWLEGGGRAHFMAQPPPLAPVRTTSAEQARADVLRFAGSLPRDRVTLRTVEEVASGRGRWGRNAPDAPTDAWFTAGLDRGTPLADRDGDGMPDDWERARGLDPADPDDHARMLDSGYSALETYLAELAAQLIERQMEERELILLLGGTHARAWPIHELHGHRVVNRGVDGDDGAALVARFEREVASVRPRAVLVWGLAEGLDGGLPLERRRADLRGRADAIVRLARRSGVALVLAMEAPTPPGGCSVLSTRLRRAMDARIREASVVRSTPALDGWLRGFAADAGVEIVDARAVLDGADLARAGMCTAPGRSGLSDAQYRGLAVHADAAVERALRSR